jgi:hypothetical protein
MSTWRKSSAVWLGSSLCSTGPSKTESVMPRVGIVVLAELGEAHVAHPKSSVRRSGVRTT